MAVIAAEFTPTDMPQFADLPNGGQLGLIKGADGKIVALYKEPEND